MMILTPALVLIIGIFMIIKGVMTLGEYVAFTTFMTYMLGPLKFFFTSNITFQDFKVALERVSQAFAWPLSHEYLYQGKKSGFFELKKGDIEIESVNFSYDEPTQKEKEKGSFVLKDITLHIKQGERIALMGKSGSGKTTLLKLIMGLFLPVMGSIRIGGQPYTRIDILRLRKHIAYIEQEPVLFKGSIAKNIVLNTQGHHDNKNKIEKAARFANAHDFIMQMEKGYNTALDRLGSNLSVGQKQRIALSRFFYKGADILILDEPTSAVDIQSTELIKESLKKVPPQKTIIMVTHDPLIARFSDRVVILDDGEIKGDYSFDEIKETDDFSIFKSMESGGQ
jgi:ABC-type bacteriocin/lantibiotic exporter with double-glycine peptidase domain